MSKRNPRKRLSAGELNRRRAQQEEAEAQKGVNSLAKIEPLNVTIRANYVSNAANGGSTWGSPSSPAASPWFQSPSQYIYPSSGTLFFPPGVTYSLSPFTSNPESPSQRRLPHRRVDAPAVGFRSWNGRLVSPKRGVLVGTGYNQDWPGTTIHATCRNPDVPHKKKHRSPHPACWCGIYAYNAVEGAAKAGGFIVGAIVAWGRVVEHGDEGFRAAHAKVIALALRPRIHYSDYQTYWNNRHVTEEMARVLKVPAVPFESLEQYAYEFGESLV